MNVFDIRLEAIVLHYMEDGRYMRLLMELKDLKSDIEAVMIRRKIEDAGLMESSKNADKIQKRLLKKNA